MHVYTLHGRFWYNPSRHTLVTLDFGKWLVADIRQQALWASTSAFWHKNQTTRKSGSE